MIARANERHQHFAALRKVLPGLFLCAVITATAFWAAQFPYLSGVSPMLLAVILGILFRALLGTFDEAGPGIALSMRLILRIAIVLLGLLTTLSQIAAIGPVALAILYTTVAASLVFTLWTARLLGVEGSLGMLLGSGTAICGASAIVATNSNIGARHGDVVYALAAVTIIGSVAMVLYPILGEAIGLDPRQYGLWVGASLHEVAQVVAAGYQFGTEAGETATVAKLARIIALAPVVALLGYLVRRKARAETSVENGARIPLVPWFVLGFAAMVVLNSVIDLPAWFSQSASVAVSFMMAMALAAVGLETDMSKLGGKGMRPLLLGILAALFISAFSLTAIVLLV